MHARTTTRSLCMRGGAEKLHRTPALLRRMLLATLLLHVHDGGVRVGVPLATSRPYSRPARPPHARLLPGRPSVELLRARAPAPASADDEQQLTASQALLIYTLAPPLLALLVPGGLPLATAYPVLQWVPALRSAAMAASDDGGEALVAVRAPQARASAVALLGSMCIVGAEWWAHLDLGSQGAALASAAASCCLSSVLPPVTGTDALLAPSRSRPRKPRAKRKVVDPEVAEQRREALSERKSWDARLQWRERKARGRNEVS